MKLDRTRGVLFLVDRSNLGEQAEKEFQGFRTPDDHRRFTELYTVQRLTSNTIGAASKVVVTTIQRLYSMLKGESAFAADDEAASQFESAAAAPDEPLPVVYNAACPPEYFDVIVIDECHRSIYTVWRQVLEYFDAFLHVAASVEMTVDDLDYAPFAEQGGLGRATQVFGDGLRPLLEELNEALAA